MLEHLESHQWNLEAAVQDALNEKEGRVPIFGATPPPRPPPATRTQSSQQSRVISSAGSRGGGAVVRREGWMDWAANLMVYPLRFIVGAANELFQLIGTRFKCTGW